MFDGKGGGKEDGSREGFLNESAYPSVATLGIDLALAAKVAWVVVVVVSTKALWVGRRGFDDASVIVYAYFQILGPQGGSMELLQEVRHACRR